MTRVCSQSNNGREERNAYPATETAWQTTPGAKPNRDGNAESSPSGDNSAGRCQARRPGRLLEAMCKHGPRGMAVTYRLRKRAVPYRTRLTGRLISLSESVFEENASF